MKNEHSEMHSNNNEFLVDSGINLCHESFDPDRSQVLEAARAAGVGHMVITGSCENSNEQALQLSQQRPHELSATAGIHPHHANKVTTETWVKLKKLLKADKVKAVGETGLDFFRNFSDHRVQEKVFEQHLALAAETQKPLFLHQRDAHERFLPIIKAYRPEFTKAVVHCFTDQQQALFDYLDLDLHIGITGWICDDQRGEHLRPLVANIPSDRLLIETDGPYLLPKNMRPKPKTRRNEPKFLPHIAQFIAECRSESYTELVAHTHRTTKAFFNI